MYFFPSEICVPTSIISSSRCSNNAPANILLKSKNVSKSRTWGEPHLVECMAYTHAKHAHQTPHPGTTLESIASTIYLEENSNIALKFEGSSLTKIISLTKKN